jgi:hypothetical protein
MPKPAGWYPDPDGAEGVVRWWDGEAWTEELGTLSTDADGWTALDTPDGPKTLRAGARPGRALTWLREEWAALRAKPHTLKVIAAPAVVLVVALGAVFGLTVTDNGAVQPTATTVQGGGPVLPPACTRTGYSRAKFGGHPSSADRAAVLVLRAAADGSVVDPYTGDVHASIAGMDLDHVLPLAWAFDHGACNWPMQLRIMLATDPHNLVFTSASLNRSKGDQSPATWLPPVDPCGYWARFQELATFYRLTLDPPGADGYAKACEQ